VSGASAEIKAVIPAKAGIQYAAASRFITSVSEILDHPLEPVIGQRLALTRSRMMTAVFSDASRVTSAP
jgi:hypothetical protein